jgi:hypothetical protein
LSGTKSKRSSEIFDVSHSEVNGFTKTSRIASYAGVPSRNVSPACARWVFQPAHIVAASKGGKG